MRLTSKLFYGIRALIDLALHAGGPPVQSHEIALRQGIPESYLNQLLILLRRGGLIRSVRGPQGGHLLARGASAVTLADVVRALDGPTDADSAQKSMMRGVKTARPITRAGGMGRYRCSHHGGARRRDARSTDE